MNNGKSRYSVEFVICGKGKLETSVLKRKYSAKCNSIDGIMVRRDLILKRILGGFLCKMSIGDVINVRVEDCVDGVLIDREQVLFR